MSRRVVEATCHGLRDQLWRATASREVDLLQQAINGARPLAEQLIAWSEELRKAGCYFGSVECWAMGTALTFEIDRAERRLVELERESA